MIKKHKNKNHYFVTKSGGWVRDFSRGFPLDVNDYGRRDYGLFLGNELSVTSMNLPKLGGEKSDHRKAVIVSDGPDLAKNLKLLDGVDTMVVGVNGALNHWTPGVKMDFYVTNNPSVEVMGFISRASYFPPCVLSMRSFPDFAKKYLSRGGDVRTYSSAPFHDFDPKVSQNIVLDDYRNPVCAAVSLCRHAGVSDIMLLCTQDYYADEKPGTIRVDDGTFMYPQQVLANEYVDAMGYWFLREPYSENRLFEFGGGQRLENFKKVVSLDEFLS